MVSNYDDPLQGADPTALRAELLRRINARSGYYAPPESQPVQPQSTVAPEPTGFGAIARKVGQGLGVLTSGRQAANAVGGLFGHPTIGTDAQHQIERIPLLGRPLGFAADVASSPLTIATAGFGGVLGAGVRGASEAAGVGGFGRFLAPAVEPLVAGNLGVRTGAAVAAAGGSTIAEKAAKGAGLPEPLQIGAGLLGGLAGIRTVGNIAEGITRSKFGGLLPAERDALLASEDPVDRMSGLLSMARVDRKTLAEAQHVARGERAGEIAQATVGMDPQEALSTANTILRGPLTDTPAFTLPEGFKMDENDIGSITQRVHDYYTYLNPLEGGRMYDRKDAVEALNSLFTGNLPTPYDIKLLQRALGLKFGGSLRALAGNKSGWQEALDIAGVPRALMASVDVSIPFRQGIVGITRKDFWREMKPMFQAFGDEKVSNDLMERLATSTHPVDMALREGGVFTGLGGLVDREEPYMSTMAEYFPGVKQSGRAAVTYLNKLRSDLGQSVYNKWVTADKNITTEDVGSLANYISIMTGRGELPSVLNNFQNAPTLLNNLFFAPRFITSRLALLNPRTYMQMTPLVRREAIRDMAGFVGLGMTGLGVLGMAVEAGIMPDAHVELDPRSSDFGKVRFGNTRIDPWGGFQPYARYAAQLITGKAKNSVGDINERNRATTLGNMVRGKLAPIPSFIVDALTGNSFIGQEVDVGKGIGLEREAAERLAPMFLQDLADAIQSDGYSGALKAWPSAFGVGVQTYNSVNAIRGNGAMELYKKPYDQLTGQEKANVNLTYADMIAKQQAPADNTVAGFINNEDLNMRGFEQRANEALKAGQVTNSDFTKGMNDAMTARIQRIQGVVDFHGEDQIAPNVLDKYFALRDQATNAAGIVDYQRLDQLQHDFIASLPQDEQRIITERTSFSHAPEVKWWVDAKKTITDSGYYQSQTKAMDTLKPLLDRLGVADQTYAQIQALAMGSDSPGTKAILQAVLKRIDQVTTQYKSVARLRDKDLDKALTLVYGQVPIMDKLTGVR